MPFHDYANQGGQLRTPAPARSSLAVALGAAALGVFLLAGSLFFSAQASASGYKLKGTFGGAAQPGFGKPIALAVDPASGDLLVVDVEAQTLSRFNPDGTPDNFSAIGTNVINGKRSGAVNECPTVPSDCDQTPQNGLNFATEPKDMQVAVDASCTLHEPPLTELTTPTCAEFDPANGDIYVTQRPSHLIDIFDSSGEYLGQLTEFKEGPSALGPLKPLSLTVGVAVDPAGDVYVNAFDGTLEGEIHKYAVTVSDPVTNEDNIANFTVPGFGRLAAGFKLNAGSIFSTEYHSKVVRLNATSGSLQCQITPEESRTVTANPANGHLFNMTASEVKEFEGSCASSPEQPVASFAPVGGNLNGVAVDGAKDLVYVARAGLSTIEVWQAIKVPDATTLPPDPVGAAAATLQGEVNPNGLPLTQCAFEWGETPAYGHLAPCEAPNATEVGAGTAFVPVHADISGLDPGTSYHAQLVVTNANNAPGEAIEGGDVKFKSLGPSVQGEEVSEVAATTAKIGATIDPNGEETSFFVEYLDDSAFQANPESDRFAGAARAPLSDREIPAVVSGAGNIQAGSEIITGVISNAGAFGPGETISGPGIPVGATILSLPTPTQLKISKSPTATAAAATLTATGPQPIAQLLSGLEPETIYHFRVKASNSAATVVGAPGELTTFVLPEAGGPCANEGLRQGLSAGLPDCRAYEMISPPQKAGEVIPPEPAGEFGGSCSECLPGINIRAMPMQSAPAGNSVLYRGQAFSGGLAAGQNQYLSGRSAADWSLQSLSPPSITGFWEAFSEDLSRGVLAQADPPLSPEAPTRGGLAFANLYLRGGGGAFSPLIATEPPRRDPGHTGANSFQVKYAGANAGTGAAPAFGHVVFEANDALTPVVGGIAPAAPEVSEVGSECTVSPCNLYEWTGGQLSLVNVLPGNSSAAGNAVIGSGRLLGVGGVNEAPNASHAISDDGRRVFWSSEETGHVYARVDGAGTVEIPGPATCKESVAQSSRACFLTASMDGSEVLLSNGVTYRLNQAGSAYVEAADLTAGEGGFRGILGAAEDLSRVYFVDTAALTGGEENANEEVAKNSAPNLYAWQLGGSTRFISALLGIDDQFGVGSLYGTWHASPADRTAQVSADGSHLAFMSRAQLTGYDNTIMGKGSCVPGISQPVCGEVFQYEAGSGTLTCASCNPSGKRPLGASNLTLMMQRGGPAFPQPGNLSSAGDGRLFFESQDALVPQDINGPIQDVYQWEPKGVGGCAKARGCVQLISSGQSPSDSMFVDSSDSGNDVFFITRQQLLPRDKDSQLDLYDARVGGGFAETAGPPCAGEACKGPISPPPSQPGAASQSFSGPGNAKPAKKARKKHAKHQKKKHKRAKRNRGGRK
jgi:hypothetical protein